MNNNFKKEIDRIYDLAVNSTYDETEFNDNIISLVDIRDLAIDGNYENNEIAYKNMIKMVLTIGA